MLSVDFWTPPRFLKNFRNGSWEVLQGTCPKGALEFYCHFTWIFGMSPEFTRILLQKPGNHPNFRKNALGAKRPFSELWESSGVFSEQLSGFDFEIPFSEYELPFSEWHPTTWAIRKPKFSEQLPEWFPELMGTHMKDLHLPLHSRSVFFKNWGGPHAPEFYYNFTRISLELHTGPIFVHPHPPHPWKYPPRGGGCIKGGGV